MYCVFVVLSTVRVLSGPCIVLLTVLVPESKLNGMEWNGDHTMKISKLEEVPSESLTQDATFLSIPNQHVPSRPTPFL